MILVHVAVERNSNIVVLICTNKRQRWNNLEETIRSIVEESFEKYSNRGFIADALATFDKDVDFEDISEKRLFFDWIIHDYEIKDDNYNKSSITIIQKSLENLKNENSIDGYKKEKEKEKEILEMWTHSAFRFYEVIEIKKGSGYTVVDIFDNIKITRSFYSIILLLLQ